MNIENIYIKCLLKCNWLQQVVLWIPRKVNTYSHKLHTVVDMNEWEPTRNPLCKSLKRWIHEKWWRRNFKSAVPFQMSCMQNKARFIGQQEWISSKLGYNVTTFSINEIWIARLRTTKMGHMTILLQIHRQLLSSSLNGSIRGAFSFLVCIFTHL